MKSFILLLILIAVTLSQKLEDNKVSNVVVLTIEIDG